MKKRFSDEQIISILREAEAGVSARELCRKHAISDATFYTWRKKYGGTRLYYKQSVPLSVHAQGTSQSSQYCTRPHVTRC